MPKEITPKKKRKKGNLKEAASGVPDAHGKNPFPQERVDRRGLAVAGAPEEGHLHVVSLQHLPDPGHLPA